MLAKPFRWPEEAFILRIASARVGEFCSSIEGVTVGMARLGASLAACNLLVIS